jgi:hypothetical protein
MQSGGARLRKFKSPNKKYRSPNFKTTKRPFSPSPKRKDYEKIAQTKPSQERCTYIDPESNRRCKLHIGIYPKYCHIHTTLIENLFVAPSSIPNGGNGLFAGPLGFKKNDIIGEYSQEWMEVKSGRLDKRNGKDKSGEYKDVNYSYIFCDEQKKGQKEKDVQCWDGLDKNSTIVRNANDAHGSKHRNNAYFDTRKGKDGKTHVYMIASRNIAGLREVRCDYGNSYFI